MPTAILKKLNASRTFPVFRDHMPSKSLGFDQIASANSIDFPAFSYLFLQNRNLIEWDRKQIPISHVWAVMQKYALPTYVEYVETTDSPAFLAICETFFRSLFWCGCVYVGCNLFGDSSPTDFNYFSIWLKVNPEIFGDIPETREIAEEYKNRFINLEDGKEYEIEDWETELVKISWPLLNNFPEWFNFAYQTIINNKLLQNLTYCSGKVSVIEYDGADASQATDPHWINENMATINNPNSAIFYDRHGQGGEINPITLVTAEHLKGVTLSVYHVRDRELAELGRVANTNPKGDRLSTGENYKDLIGVANRQRAVLNTLKLFALRIKEKGGPELVFAMNGIPERSTMMSDSETASLPGQEGQDQPGNNVSQ